jgi:hypothetical protein
MALEIYRRLLCHHPKKKVVMITILAIVVLIVFCNMVVFINPRLKSIAFLAPAGA